MLEYSWGTHSVVLNGSHSYRAGKGTASSLRERRSIRPRPCLPALRPPARTTRSVHAACAIRSRHKGSGARRGQRRALHLADCPERSPALERRLRLILSPPVVSRTRHGIPHGTVSHTARYPARHGILHGTVFRTARYPARPGLIRRPSRLKGPSAMPASAKRSDSGCPERRAAPRTWHWHVRSIDPKASGGGGYPNGADELFEMARVADDLRGGSRRSAQSRTRTVACAADEPKRLQCRPGRRGFAKWDCAAWDLADAPGEARARRTLQPAAVLASSPYKCG